MYESTRCLALTSSWCHVRRSNSSIYTGCFQKSFATLKQYTNLYRGICSWRILRPQQRRSVKPLLHGDGHYRCRVPGHTPTVRRIWPRRTQPLPATRRTHHYLAEEREYLNGRFPGRWICRAAPIAWRARSLHLKALDSLNDYYPRKNSACFAALRQLKTLYTSSG
jgi:hypothetical protein